MDRKRLPVVYIAGKFRGANTWEVQRNIHAAQERALQVWQSGAVALCPHANTAGYDGTLPDQVFLEGALELLVRCDAVLTVDGWENSRGATAEVQCARERGMPLFDDIGILREWIGVWKGSL